MTLCSPHVALLSPAVATGRHAHAHIGEAGHGGYVVQCHGTRGALAAIGVACPSIHERHEPRRRQCDGDGRRAGRPASAAASARARAAAGAPRPKARGIKVTCGRAPSSVQIVVSRTRRRAQSEPNSSIIRRFLVQGLGADGDSDIHPVFSRARWRWGIANRLRAAGRPLSMEVDARPLDVQQAEIQEKIVAAREAAAITQQKQQQQNESAKAAAERALLREAAPSASAAQPTSSLAIVRLLRRLLPVLVGVIVAVGGGSWLPKHDGDDTVLLEAPVRLLLIASESGTDVVALPDLELSLPVPIAATLVALLVVELLAAVLGCCCARERNDTEAVADEGDDAHDDLELTLAMLSAIETDTPAAIDRAVARGANIHGPLRGACGITAPQLAAILGKCTALRHLQALGADLVECHPTRMLGGNCIHAAALGSHASTTGYLIDESGLYGKAKAEEESVDSPLRNGMTALFLACQAGNLGVVKRLTIAGADATMRRKDGSTCLFVSAKNGHSRVVDYLLTHTRAVDTMEVRVTKGMQYSGATALWVAAEKGRIETLERLLEAGAAPHVCNIAGASALMVAADCGQLEVVHMLLPQLSLPQICANDCNGCGALSFAIDQGHVGISKLLQRQILHKSAAATAGGSPSSAKGGAFCGSSPRKSAAGALKQSHSHSQQQREPTTTLAAAESVGFKVGLTFTGEQPTGLMRGSWRCGVATSLPTGALLPPAVTTASSGGGGEDEDEEGFELALADYPELFELLLLAPPEGAAAGGESESERAAIVRAVEGSCSQMHGTFLDVQSVYRVTSPGAVQRRYQETLGLLHAPTDMQLQNLFHGTTESAMLSICQHGFDPDHASFRGGGGGSGASAGPKMFGNGLYLATNAVGAVFSHIILTQQHNMHAPGGAVACQ